MNTTINERLAALIEAVGKNTSSFARSLDKAYTSVESIVKGKTKPSYDLLDAILTTYPQVSPDWLMKGEGDMFRSEQPVNKPADGGAFGESVLLKLSSSMEDLRRMYDEELRAKNQQIAFLQRMLEGAMPGKTNDVTTDRSVVRMHPATEHLSFALVEQA